MRFLLLILLCTLYFPSTLALAKVIDQKSFINHVSQAPLAAEKTLSNLNQKLQIAVLIATEQDLAEHSKHTKILESELYWQLELYYYLLLQHGEQFEPADKQIRFLKKWLAQQANSSLFHQALSQLTDAVETGRMQGKFELARDKLDKLLMVRLDSSQLPVQWLYYEAYQLRVSLGWLLKEKQSQKTFLDKAKMFADMLGAPLFIAEISTKFGRYYQKQNNFKLALEHFGEAAKSYTQAKATNKLGDIYIYQSRLLAELNLFDEAKDKALLAKDIFEKLDLSSELADAYHTLADIYSKRQDYNQAIDLYLEALKLQRNLGKHIAQAISHYNIADNYLLLGNLEDSFKHATIADKFFTDRNLKHYQLHSGYLLGKIYQKQELHQQAISSLEKAREFALSFDSAEELMEISKILLELYPLEKNFEAAFKLQQEIYGNAHSSDKTDVESYEIKLQNLSEKLRQQKLENKVTGESYQQLSILSWGLISALSLLIIITLLQRYRHSKGKQVLANISDDNIRERYTKLPGLNALEAQLNKQTSHTLIIICFEDLLNQDIHSGLEQLNLDHQRIYHALNKEESMQCFLARPGLFAVTFNHNLNLPKVISLINTLLAKLPVPKQYSLGLINLPFLKLEHFVFDPSKLYQIALYACNLSMQSRIREHVGVSLETINSASAVMFNDPLFDNLALNLNKGIIKKGRHKLL